MFNVGDMVYYLGCPAEHVNCGSDGDSNNVLVQGYVYGVERVEVHNQHTKIKLVSKPGWYDSLYFERYPL